MDDTNKTKRFMKITDADRARMIRDREDALDELRGSLDRHADCERADIRRDIERLSNRTRKVVFDTELEAVRYVKGK